MSGTLWAMTYPSTLKLGGTDGYRESVPSQFVRINWPYGHHIIQFRLLTNPKTESESAIARRHRKIMGRLAIAFAPRVLDKKRLKYVATVTTQMISDYLSKVFARFVISILLITGFLSADPKNPDKSAINGEWKFNLTKSNLANMPVPQQATLLVSVHGNRLMWRETGVREDGTRYDYTFNGFIDGKPYALEGASRVSIRFHRENDAIVGKWKGKGKRISIAKVAEDGKLLIVENVSTVYNMVGNWTTAWDKVPASGYRKPRPD